MDRYHYRLPIILYMFLFKKKPIHLECFISRTNIIDYAPISKAAQYYPNWWSSLAKSSLSIDLNGVVLNKTMKGCAGFNDFYSNSICIPAWSDFHFFGKDGNAAWQFADLQSEAHCHPKQQYGEFLTLNQMQLKLLSPWMFRCKESVKWVFVGNIWNQNYPGRINILPGVLDFKYQHATNINCVFNSSDPVTIKVGEPLVNIFPMSDREVVLHLNEVSDAYLSKLSDGVSISLINGYHKKKKLMQDLETNSKSKCPFH